MAETTASIQDVAYAAGVSKSTVSNVLNRPATVAQATLSRVLSAIEDLNYVRNEQAASLRLGMPTRKPRRSTRKPPKRHMPGRGIRNAQAEPVLNTPLDSKGTWQGIKPGQIVLVYLHDQLVGKGTVNDAMPDGSAMWLYYHDGRGRMLILREDGYVLTEAVQAHPRDEIVEP